MDYKIQWLRSATEDFKSIFLYYSSVGGERVAKKRLDKILQATSYLGTMPYLGRQDDVFKNTELSLYCSNDISHLLLC